MLPSISAVRCRHCYFGVYIEALSSPIPRAKPSRYAVLFLVVSELWSNAYGFGWYMHVYICFWGILVWVKFGIRESGIINCTFFYTYIFFYFYTFVVLTVIILSILTLY